MKNLPIAEFDRIVLKKEKNNNILKKLSPLKRICDIILKCLKIRKECRTVGKNTAMTKFISSLEQLYANSGIPVAIADSSLNIIRRNPLASAENSPLNIPDVSELINSENPSTGKIYRAEGAVIHSYNVLKTELPDENDFCYVIEYLGADNPASLTNSPALRDYITYLCARIRDSAGKIAVCADSIDAAAAYYSSGNQEICDSLNSINHSMMMLLREVVNPEQIYCTADLTEDETVLINEEIQQAADDAKTALGDSSIIINETDEKLYTRMNRSVFETVIASMTANCCMGELYPDEIIFSAKRTAPQKMCVSVRSLNTSGRKNPPPRRDLSPAGKDFCFDTLRSILSEKYNAVFSRSNLPDGILYSMEISALPSGKTPIIKNASKFVFRNERFSTMILSLAEHHLEKRYKYIDIDK